MNISGRAAVFMLALLVVASAAWLTSGTTYISDSFVNTTGASTALLNSTAEAFLATSGDWGNVSISESQIMDFGSYVDESGDVVSWLNVTGALNVTDIGHTGNITNPSDSGWGIFNNGSCIVIGNLSYVSEC